MASIRRLKKDVDYLTFAVIEDCMNYNAVTDEHEAEVVDIIQSVIDYRNQMRNKINTREKFAGKKEKHAYFKGLAIDLLKTVDGHFTRLSDTLRKG